jgi:hypothetical protein
MEAARSVRSQTFLDFEWILLINGEENAVIVQGDKI